MSIRKVLIKRRKENQVGSGPPNSLLNGELGFDEKEQVLYYGSGDDGNGNAININPIAGGFTTILQNSQLSSFPTPLQETNNYLIITINGTQKAIKLYDL